MMMKATKKLQALILALVILAGAVFAVPVYGKTVKASKVDKITFQKKDGKKYGFDGEGNPLSGWSKDKKYYFYEDGEAAAGIVAINGKFFRFGAAGKYNEAKTKELRKLAKYGKPFAPLKKLIGEPKKSDYSSEGCYNGDGLEGVLTYDRFTVYTFKPKQGEEIFWAVE